MGSVGDPWRDGQTEIGVPSGITVSAGQTFGLHTVHQFHSGPLAVHRRVFSPSAVSFTVSTDLLPAEKIRRRYTLGSSLVLFEGRPNVNFLKGEWELLGGAVEVSGRSQPQTCTACNTFDS